MRASAHQCSIFVAVLAFAVHAEASAISFQNQIIQGGTGHGAVATILVLQGDSSTESGGVTWNGSADVTSGDAKNQSQTYSVADLLGPSLQITNADTEFGLVFDINDTDTSFILQLLTVNFLDSSGVALAGVPSASFVGPVALEEGSQGVGNSGFLFRVQLSAAERNAFFGPTNNFLTNRLALSVATVDNVDNGPDSVYLVDLEGRDPGTPGQFSFVTPEPGSLILLGSGLLLFAARIRRKR